MGIRDSAARAKSDNETVGLVSIPTSGVWPVVRARSKPRPTQTYTKLPGIIPIKVAARNWTIPMRVSAGTIFNTQNGTVGTRRRARR